MTTNDKINDFFHWLAVGVLGALGFVIDHGNEIVILCAVICGLLQVYIQFRRAMKS